MGKWSNLTNIFQLGWNHQLVNIVAPNLFFYVDDRILYKHTLLFVIKKYELVLSWYGLKTASYLPCSWTSYNIQATEQRWWT